MSFPHIGLNNHREKNIADGPRFFLLQRKRDCSRKKAASKNASASSIDSLALMDFNSSKGRGKNSVSNLTMMPRIILYENFLNYFRCVFCI